PEVSSSNPGDMIASASADHYGRAIRTLHRSGEVDALVVMFAPPLVTRAEDVAEAIRSAAGRFGPRPLPIVTVFMSAHGVPPELRTEDVRIPSYRFPEDAAAALARAAEYGVWRSKPEGRVPSFLDVRTDDALLVV